MRYFSLALIFIFLIMPASAQVADPKPNVWRSVLAQAAAVSFDAWATRRFVQNGYVEKDPAVKFIMGSRPSNRALVAGAIGETSLTTLIVRRYPRLRWVQIGAAVTHGGLAFANLRLSRNRK